MNRFIKIIVPSLLMLLLIYLWRNDKDILSGLYIVFPIMYIIQGLICTSIKNELLLSLTLLTLSFLVPINFMFNMGTCIDCAIIYNILAITCYLIKRKIKNNS